MDVPVSGDPTGALGAEFTGYACQKLTQHLSQIVRCVGLLNDADLWRRANEHTNSVGNLVLHLTGNVGQWILGGLGGGPIARDRSAEFAERGPLPGAEIASKLQSNVDAAVRIIGQLAVGRLLAHHEIQGYKVSGLVVVFHVVEHFAGHAGQIVHITKTLRDLDLSAYDSKGQRQTGVKNVP